MFAIDVAADRDERGAGVWRMSDVSVKNESEDACGLGAGS